MGVGTQIPMIPALFVLNIEIAWIMNVLSSAKLSFTLSVSSQAFNPRFISLVPGYLVDRSHRAREPIQTAHKIPYMGPRFITLQVNDM